MWIASIEDATNIITNLEIRQSIYASGLVFFLYRMCITKYALLRTWYYNIQVWKQCLHLLLCLPFYFVVESGPNSFHKFWLCLRIYDVAQSPLQFFHPHEGALAARREFQFRKPRQSYLSGVCSKRGCSNCPVGRKVFTYLFCLERLKRFFLDIFFVVEYWKGNSRYFAE